MPVEDQNQTYTKSYETEIAKIAQYYAVQMYKKDLKDCTRVEANECYLIAERIVLDEIE